MNLDYLELALGQTANDMCSLTVPGPCDYCQSIGAPCQIDIGRRKRRPFYFVLEEEYRHMKDILRYYLPNEELTLPALRAIASRCAKNSLPMETQQYNDQQPGQLQSGRVVHASEMQVVSEIPEIQAKKQEDDSLQEIVHLHHDLGCMLADSRGEYREFLLKSKLQISSKIIQVILGLIRARASMLQ